MKPLDLSVVSRRLAIFALAALAALAPAVASAATYYIATTGSDSNAGTIAAPFASIARAQTAAVAGDTVYVRGGTYTTFTIFATDANYNYVNRLNKSGVNWSAYPGETPVFDFSSVPTNLRVCGFHVTGSGITVTGFVVTGVKDGTQKQSECFRIDGSAANVDFIDCVAHDNAANGFYFTNHARGSCTRCDSYNNIGTNGDSIGNTDGFGAHGDGTVFRYCRSWNNSDDGYDCISATGSNTFDHCWAYNMRAGGDSNGFKVGGYGSGTVPGTVPSHTVMYCLSANNNAHGFYANHQPAKGADWLHNTAYNQSAGNFDMLERVSPTDITDIPGFREVLHNNVSFAGTIIKDDANPAAAVTENSWTKPGVTVASDDFVSLDASQMIAPRSAGNNMPFITFMHLAPGSDLAGLGCFDPSPPAPTNVHAAWANSGRVDLTWTASPGATEYYVRRATTSGGPYTSIAVRLSGTSFSDTTVGGNATYFYQVSAMNNVSYDEGVSAEAVASIPAVMITGVALDSGRFATDGITNDSTLVLAGTAGAGSTVVVSRVGVGTIGTTTADGAGAWSFDYTGTSLPEGTHTFQVTSTDISTGDSFTSDPFVVTVDTTAPVAPVIGSVGAAPGSLTISGSAEPAGQVAVILDGSISAGTTIAGVDGTWSLVYAGVLSADIHSFTAVVTDVAGNTSAPGAAFQVDTRVTTPAITAAQSDFGSLGNGALTRDKTLSFTGTGGAGDGVTLARGGSAIGSTVADGTGNWSFDYTGTVLPDGVSNFTATGSNGVGTSPSSQVFTVTVDSLAPAVLSIARQNPTSATVTSAVASLVYRVAFSETVSGVDAGDFALTTTGGASGVVAGVSSSSGAVFDVTVNTLAGAGTLRLDLKASGTGIADGAGNPASGFTAGEIYTRVVSTTGNGTWIDPVSGGLWSDAGNWLNAVIPSASTHSADFSTLDLTTTNIVHLDSTRTINSAKFGDTDLTTPGSWFLDNNGLATNTLTLAGTVPTITVNALGTDATATIGARLAGTGGFTKAGPGTLVLAAANTLSGALNTTGGVLRLDAGGSLSNTTIGVGTGSLLDVSGGSLTASGNTTITGAANTALLVDDGAASLALVTFTAADGGLFRINGGNVTASAITIPRSTDSTIRYTTGFVMTGGNATVTGAINLGTGNSNGVMSIEGGALTVNGVITVGNQITGTRGGAMRVIGGAFTSTNTATGIVLSKTNGTNANNVSFATFSGGVSSVEKFTLGFDGTVTAGSATITVNGGALYLGSGGIVKNGTAGMATNLNFSGGIVGAKASWSTALPISLPAGGNVQLKAASAGDAPFNITLSGVVSNAGGFTKTGDGTLTLSAANTFTGSAMVEAGTLNVTGSLAAGGVVAVDAGGTLAGTGTVNKDVTLNSGGTIAPAGTLTAASLTWNDGGALAFDLGATADQLTLNGAFNRGSSGVYVFNFTPGAGLAIGNVYPLATFVSTTFSATDFSFTGLPAGMTGAFSIDSNQLLFTVMGPPAITSAATASGTYGAPFSYAVTATNLPLQFDASGLPAGLSVDPLTGVISGSPAATGDFAVTIIATNGAGTGSATLTLSVAKAAASVALGGLTRTYTGSQIGATATTVPAGLNVVLTYDGSMTRPTNAGSYLVVGTIDDANYFGSAQATLTINPASAVVTLGSLNQIYSGTPRPATATTVPAGLAVTFTYDGGATPPTHPGSYAVVATVNDPNYTGTVTGVLVVVKATASVALGNLTQTYDGSPKSVSVTTVPVGLATEVMYNGSTTAPTNAGSYAVFATVHDTDYAGSAAGTLTIAQSTATVTLGDLTQAYDGTPRAASAVTVPSGLDVTFTYDGNAAAPTLPGSYAVVGTINDPNYSGSASGTLVVGITALVRHAPTLNADIDGSVQLLLPESTTLNGSAMISGDLLVPGTPGLVLNGHPTYGGTIDGTGSATPSNYSITLNGSSVLRHAVRRTNAIAMPTVAVPPQPAGTRNVSINSAGQSAGDFATLRNLTLNGNVGTVAVPAGTYGIFTANGSSNYSVGVAGATEPAVYNLQGLTLNGNSQLQILGPVIINLASGVSINGNIGSAAHPEWLTLNVASGGVTLNGNVNVSGRVVAPNGTVTINGGSTLNGTVASDRLTLNGNALLNDPAP